jgi:hypothetical protein
MAQTAYDRSAEDLGNIVNIGHVNVRIPDQRLSTLFHVTGLGLTRDPFLMTSTNNMWINVGMSQFHLPTGEPQVLRGVTGLVVPSREQLLDRLARVKPELAGTQFAYRETNDAVETVSPWGNRIACHAPDATRYGRIVLGMPYVAFEVRPGTVEAIARFYREIVGAQATVEDGNGAGRAARIGAGDRQHLIYRETDAPERPYDNNHIQVYVQDFSGMYKKLQARGLISEESDQHQYRFRDIVDLDTDAVLTTIDHEIRSMTHPMFGRPLVNRNPDQTNRDYRPGHDALPWAMA